MRRGLLLAITLFCPALLPTLPGQDRAPALENILLPNGTKIVLLRRPKAPIAFVATFCATGLETEGPGEEGLSRILATESLTGTMTVGSPGWSQEEKWHRQRDELLLAAIRAKIEETTFPAPRQKKMVLIAGMIADRTTPNAWMIKLEEEGGAPLTALTTFSGFSLSTAIPATRAARFLALEANRLQSAALRTIVDTSARWRQKQAEEYEQDPRRRALSALLGQAFRRHSYRRALALPPAGPIRWTRANSFWQREVRPHKTAIAIVGPWPKKLGEIAQSLFANRPGPKPPALPQVKEPAQDGPRTAAALPQDPPLAIFGWRISKDMDRATLLVLGDLLGNNHQGYLTTRLVRDQGILGSARVTPSFPAMVGPRLFLVEVSPREGKTGIDAADMLQEFIPDWRPTATKVAEAGKRVQARLLALRSSPRYLATALARVAATGQDTNQWLALPQRVAKITEQQINDLVARLFTANRRNLLTTGATGICGEEAR